MRKPPVALLIVMLGWLGASSAPTQDCCHRSIAPTHPTISANPMPSFNMDDVRNEFNASSNKARVIALLSPTCSDCQSGHAGVGRMLERDPSPKLRVVLVWEPMRDGDDATSATKQAEAVKDARIAQGWDGSRDLGKLFGETLDLRQIAWDVYLVYKPGVTWKGRQPPRPTFWMHQLEGVKPNRLLCANPTRLSADVEKLLGHSLDHLP
jgi:hypothetical protein